MENNKFQNLPSKRLYYFLLEKVEKNEITYQQIADTLDVYKKNPSSYFHALKNGIISVKLDHILKTQEHFGLNPCDLFREKENPFAIVEDNILPLLKEAKPEFKDILKILAETVQSQQEELKELRANQGNVNGRTAASSA